MWVSPANHEPHSSSAWVMVPGGLIASRRAKPGSALDRGSLQVRTQQSLGLGCSGTDICDGVFLYPVARTLQIKQRQTRNLPASSG